MILRCNIFRSLKLSNFNEIEEKNNFNMSRRAEENLTNWGKIVFFYVDEDNSRFIWNKDEINEALGENCF